MEQPTDRPTAPSPKTVQGLDRTSKFNQIKILDEAINVLLVKNVIKIFRKKSF